MVFFKEKIPLECAALSEVILKIARMGGCKHRVKASPPGIKTMWTGFQLYHITDVSQYVNLNLRLIGGANGGEFNPNC